MPLTEEQINELSRDVTKALKTHTPVAYTSERFPGTTFSEAYAVQLRSLKTRLENSEVVVGRKIGLSSRANQEMFGIDQPAYGHLFEPAIIPEGEPISMGRLFHPVVEPEICFVLGDDLKGPGVDVAKVLAATAGVMPAIEIADSRYKEGWDRLKAQDLIADNCGSAMVVLGGRLIPVAGIDLRLVGMVLEVNGEVVATGAGASVLGNPAQPVAMLANALAEYGIGLRAGEIVISGSVTAAVPAEAGSSYRATFDRLGAVAVRFTD
jgi:2-keto-4-pentenoate hydratase